MFTFGKQYIFFSELHTEAFTRVPESVGLLTLKAVSGCEDCMRTGRARIARREQRRQLSSRRCLRRVAVEKHIHLVEA
jgi:hypothetical protein